MLSLRLQVSWNPTTRAPGGLLGPCFKTGRSGNRLAKPRNSQRRRRPPAPTATTPGRAKNRAARGNRRAKEPHTAPGVTSDGDLADVAPTDYNTAAPEGTAVTFPPTLSSRSIHPDAARSRREVHRQPVGRPRRPGQRQGFPHHPPTTQSLPTGRRLNPAAARLAGPTVFSLNGFTCS